MDGGRQEIETDRKEKEYREAYGKGERKKDGVSV